MTSVEIVKMLCKERNIPIYRLEKELGFSNGYISQLRKGTFPADRLVALAKYFGISTEYLMYGEETASTESSERKINDGDLKFALWGDNDTISEADLEEVRRFAAFIAERKKEKK